MSNSNPRQPDSPPPTAASAGGQSPQVVVLGTLLQLEKQARHADSQTALSFIAVNESHRLFSYRQALAWSFGATGRVKIHAVSGVAAPDPNAPFIQWVTRLIRYRSRQREQATRQHPFDESDLEESLRAGWNEWSGGAPALWCPFLNGAGKLIGGLVFFRQQPWGEAELTLAERLTDAHAHAWRALQGKDIRLGGGWRRRILIGLLLVVIIGGLFTTVRESALAPAEVIPRDPLVISAPVDGSIKTIHVQPNQWVEKNHRLFNLDATNQIHQYDIASKSLQVAQAELLSAEQKAFTDPRSKSELALLRAKVAERQAELRYVAELLERMEVRAPQAGIAVFTDANDWLGKPVSVGEKIMTLADPAHTEISLWVPVADAINLNVGAPLRLFLNTDPTRPYRGEVFQAAYEAEMSPEGVLAFRVKARFTGERAPPRIGLKGTGKIYGEQVKLYYYLFRRPLATVRQWLGI